MDSNTTHGNAKKTDKQDSNSKKLIEQIKIEGTPFTAIKHDTKWYLTLGKYRLTEGMSTFRAVQKESKDASWYRIMQIMNIMIDERIEQLKQLNQINK